MWRVPTEASEGVLLSPETDDVTYGLAEFVAAEEMAVRVGTGGPPTGPGCSSPASMSRGCSAGTSRIRPIPGALRSQSRIRRGHRQRRRHAPHHRPRRPRRRGSAVGSNPIRVRDHGGLVGAWAAGGGAEPRSAHHANPRGGCLHRGVVGAREDTDDCWIDIVGGVPATAAGRDGRLDGRSRSARSGWSSAMRPSPRRSSRFVTCSMSTATWSSSEHRRRRPRSACTRGHATKGCARWSPREWPQECGGPDARAGRRCSRLAASIARASTSRSIVTGSPHDGSKASRRPPRYRSTCAS